MCRVNCNSGCALGCHLGPFYPVHVGSTQICPFASMPMPFLEHPKWLLEGFQFGASRERSDFDRYIAKEYSAQDRKFVPRRVCTDFLSSRTLEWIIWKKKVQTLLGVLGFSQRKGIRNSYQKVVGSAPVGCGRNFRRIMAKVLWFFRSLVNVCVWLQLSFLINASYSLMKTMTGFNLIIFFCLS